jgi:hypothetical protein
MIKEFKAFISKGNVIDLAVGVIIGGGVRQNSLVAGGRRDNARYRHNNRRHQL